MNQACLVLIVAMTPVSLFAGETMVTKTSLPPGRCNFRVDNCETSVATDPSYVRFKDGASIPGPTELGPVNGDAGLYRSNFTFADYPASQQPTIEELLALIRKKLSNCPEIEVGYDNDSGDITVHYIHSAGDCCDWTVNVRDVKANDFVWKRTTDNYSGRLGQMERRKFHVTSEQDAQDIESAVARIRAINNWSSN